jgi:hypothetical protein
MFAECQLESIQRIHALRTELDNSLLSNDSHIYSDCDQQQHCRQLRTVLRTAESTHIQYTGPFLATEVDQSSCQSVRPTSRFTVSPTPPNAMPPFSASTENRKQALHVVIAKPILEEDSQDKTEVQQQNSIVVPPTSSNSVFSASSPASSIDSGVASPGSCTDDLFGISGPFSRQYRHRNSLPLHFNSTTSWKSHTLPKSHGRIFNFTTTKKDDFPSLIEALSLQSECKKKADENFIANAEEFGKIKGTVGEIELQPSIAKSDAQYPFSRSSTTSLLVQKYNSGTEEKRKERSFDCLNSGDGLPPRSATMPPLKSILKKKQSVTFGASTPSLPSLSTSTFCSNQRKGIFSRFIPFRSTFEDHIHTVERSPPLHNNIIAINNIVPSSVESSTSTSSCTEMIEEETDHGISDCFYCTSDSNNLTKIGNILNEQKIQQQQQSRQKRVSFSEQVQARVYRSTSSIIGQRKKNEKKARNRATRRCNSDETANDFERSSFLETHSGDQPSINNNGIICKTMAASDNGTNGGSGMSVLAQ